jgi:hypothetical protein
MIHADHHRLKRIARSLAATLLAGLFPVMVLAQDAPKDPPAGFTFKISSWGAWKGPELFIKHGTKWLPVEILDLAYSSPLPYNRGEPLVLARKTPSDTGEAYVPLLSVIIPEDCREPLVLLLPDAMGASRPFVVDINPKEFPWGSYQFVNFTHSKLVGLINKSMFSVEPGKVQMINPSNSENTRLAIQVKSVKGEQSKIVYSNMVINRPSKRMLIFFHSAAGGTGEPTIETRCLVDFQQPVKTGGG